MITEWKTFLFQLFSPMPPCGRRDVPTRSPKPSKLTHVVAPAIPGLETRKLGFQLHASYYQAEKLTWDQLYRCPLVPTSLPRSRGFQFPNAVKQYTSQSLAAIMVTLGIPYISEGTAIPISAHWHKNNPSLHC